MFPWFISPFWIWRHIWFSRRNMELYCTYLFLSQCYAYVIVFQYRKESQEWAEDRSAAVEKLYRAPLEGLFFLSFFSLLFSQGKVINIVIVTIVCVNILFYLISIIKLLLSPPEGFTCFLFSSPSHLVGVGERSEWAPACWLIAGWA